MDLNSTRTTKCLRDTSSSTIMPNTPETEEHRPDACLLLTTNTQGHEAPVQWENVAVVFEYKKRGASMDWHANTRRILWNLHQIMNHDPRRRFALGFTIENLSLRMWYCDRAGFLVSEQADLMESVENNPTPLVKIILAIFSASHSELGFDPTMEPVEVDGMRQYRITVSANKRYQTVRPLSNFRAAKPVAGQATRVWEVRTLDGEDQVVGGALALKDVWVKGDTHEGTIFDDIVQASEAPGISTATKDAI
ncbi:hypothetical protein FRB94_004947 [Tulasnella sp. JGI-2019a]|nr:hypothetical protein FRB94_004947 [Tulasnella sp. JGI-2019a]